MIKKIIKLVVILAVSFTAFSCTAQAIKNKDVNTAQSVDVVETYAYTNNLYFELPIQIAQGQNKSIYDYLISVTVSSTRVTVRAVGVKSDGSTLVRNTLFNDTSFSGLYTNYNDVNGDTLEYIPQNNTFESAGGNLGVFYGRIVEAGAPDSDMIKVSDVGYLTCGTKSMFNGDFVVIELYKNQDNAENEEGSRWVIGIEIPTATQPFYFGVNRLTYNDGISEGRAEGFEQGRAEGYAEGLGDGYDDGFNDGSLALNTAQAFWVGAQNFLHAMGDTIATLFSQELIPTSGIAIGHVVIGVPLLFGALALIFRFFGRRDE